MNDYCGKHYGIFYYVTGFIIGAMCGILVAVIMYQGYISKLVLGATFGLIGARYHIRYLINKRERDFSNQFCDYLDAISSSLACGKNTYDTFVNAAFEMEEFYKTDTPICIESHRLADGLKCGRGIEELLKEMAARSRNEDVEVFGEVYGICNSLGANLKEIVNDTKQAVLEKHMIEAEIHSTLSAPRNELNIMSIMPLIITFALKTFGSSFSSGNTALINTVALGIFALAYAWGTKIVKVKI